MKEYTPGQTNTPNQSPDEEENKFTFKGNTL